MPLFRIMHKSDQNFLSLKLFLKGFYLSLDAEVVATCRSDQKFNVENEGLFGLIFRLILPGQFFGVFSKL
jgi:hypothetical protein